MLGVMKKVKTEVKGCLARFCAYIFGEPGEKEFFCTPIKVGEKEFGKLKDHEKEFLLEHYRRLQKFWMHWTTTIWSIPSVASGINIGFYAYFFVKSGEGLTHINSLMLLILVALNFALTIGALKHIYMQHRFGQRIKAIEEFAGIRFIKFEGLQDRFFSGSFWYVILLLGLYALSSMFLVQSPKPASWQTATIVLVVCFGVFLLLLTSQVFRKVSDRSKKCCHCNFKIRTNWKFCPNCGHKIQIPPKSCKR
jgi:hypothetical protein